MALSPSKTDELLVEQHGRVAVITLNRPERLNAISRDMLEELSAKMVEANKDPDTRCIVLTGAGHSQAQFLQEYTVNDASQVISPNGFSTMGFTVPGAIGAKLAAPDRPVLGFAGDGDFLMTVQELAMAVQYDLDVIYVVVDNAGWQSIRDLQMDVYGEDHVTTPDGTAHPWRVELAARLVSMQDRTDGSWINRNAPRWWEGNPLLATSYALLALEACRVD